MYASVKDERERWAWNNTRPTLDLMTIPSMSPSLDYAEEKIYYKWHVSLILLVHVQSWSNFNYLGPSKFLKLGPTSQIEY